MFENDFKNHMVIAGLLETRRNLLAELIKSISKTKSHLVDCHVNHLGAWYGVSLLLGGSWDSIAKVETKMQKFCTKRGVKLHVERSDIPTPQQPLLPYLVQVTAADTPGLTDDLIHFFLHEKLPIRDLETNLQLSHYTKTPIYSLSMVIYIPTQSDIGELRDRFILFCDELNVDAVMEPLK